MSFLPSRDSEALRRLGAYRYLGRAQLEEFLFGQSRLTPHAREVATWRVLRRLKARELVTTNASLAGEPDGAPTRVAYFLTSAGRRLFGALEPELPRWRPRLRGTLLLAHALMVAEIALAFRRSAFAHPGHELITWECDWQAAEWLRAQAVLPDARLVYATEAWQISAFIEADRGSEGSRFFARKVGRYLELYRSGSWRGHLPLWPLTLTVTPTERRASELRRATEAVLLARPEGARIAKTFRFSSLDDLRGALGPLGEIWQVAGRSGRHPLINETAKGGDILD